MRRQQCAMSETTGCTTTERCPGCTWPSSCGAHASAAGERRGAKGGGGRCAAKTRGLDSVHGRGVPTRRPCGVQGWRKAAPGACAPSAHPCRILPRFLGRLISKRQKLCDQDFHGGFISEQMYLCFPYGNNIRYTKIHLFVLLICCYTIAYIP